MGQLNNSPWLRHYIDTHSDTVTCYSHSSHFRQPLQLTWQLNDVIRVEVATKTQHQVPLLVLVQRSFHGKAISFFNQSINHMPFATLGNVGNLFCLKSTVSRTVCPF